MKFKVIATDDEDYIFAAREIEASCAEYAATEWAQRKDSDGEYRIAGGSDAEVTVLNCATGERSKWQVSGEAVPILCKGDAS